MKFLVREICNAGVIESTEVIPVENDPFDLPHYVSLISPIRIEIRLESKQEEIIVAGKAATRVKLSCSRCLEFYEAEILFPFETYVSHKEKYVDVSDEIRQSLLLELPTKPLCKERCRGLCPRCGKNWNETRCHCRLSNKETPFMSLKNIEIRKN